MHNKTRMNHNLLTWKNVVSDSFASIEQLRNSQKKAALRAASFRPVYTV
jgi:hypothetical protein